MPVEFLTDDEAAGYGRDGAGLVVRVIVRAAMANAVRVGVRAGPR